MHHFNSILQKEFRPHYLSLFWVLVLTLLVAGLEALSPWPFKLLIDNVLGNLPAPEISWMQNFFALFNTKQALGLAVIAAFFLINFLSNAFSYLHSNLLKRVTNQLVQSFSSTAFRGLLGFNIGFYRQQNIGDYIYRLSYDTASLSTLIEEGILPIIVSALYLILTTIILLKIDVYLTLLSLTIVPFLIISLYFFNKRIVKISRRSERQNSSLFSYIQQSLSELRVIQAFNREGTAAHYFSFLTKNALTTEFSLFRLIFSLNLLLGLIVAISYAVVIGYGVQAVFNHMITTGLLIVFIFYLENLSQPILSIIDAISILKENNVKISRMREFFSPRSQISNHGLLVELESTRIEFQDVSIKSTEGLSILDKVSFHIEPNTTTVFLGTSGSGKTSALSLIPRLIDEPTSGKILIGGKEHTDYELHALREAISFIPQEITLFNDTIHNIIAFGNPKATFRQIQEVADLVLASDFIHRLPGKYSFKVGENGNYLSGGQRQRLLLARALIKDAPIYLFDEPFSSLDVHTRNQVATNMQAHLKGKTVILISNILDIIRQGEHFIVFDQGKIDKKFKKADLLKNIGWFTIESSNK